MFKVSCGTWRTAIIIPALGVAVKVPNIRIGTIWKHYKDTRSMAELMVRIREDVRYWYHPACTPMCLFGGYVMNLREAWFSLSSKPSEMVLPTYVSLFGVANLMPAGQLHDVSSAQLWSAALSVADWDELDPHTWSEPRNFVRDRKGRLRLVDYGDPRTQRVIRLHRESFARAFKDL